MKQTGAERTTVFRVEGMDCPDEIAELRKCLGDVAGVGGLSFNLMQATMTVEYDSTQVDADEIIRRIATAGMRAVVVEDASTKRRPMETTVPHGPLWMAITAAVGTALGATLSFVPAATVHHTTWPAALAYVLAIVAAWRYVLPKAWTALGRLRLDMNVLMTIAVIGAIGLGEWLEAAAVSVVSALASAARNGVLVKGGEFLEAIGRTRVIAIDKTGTLTRGKPVVQKIIALNDTPEQRLLELSAAIEQRSEHAIGQAIVSYANQRGASPPTCQDFQAIRGKGAQAKVDDETYVLGSHRLLEERGICTAELHRVMTEHEDCHHTVVGIASSECPLGVILLADGLRDEASSAIQDLRREGVERVVMLTGDNAGTAQAIARECGGIEPRAELLPADKVAAIEELRESHKHVVMVGDGINDAPALAAASVGVAMGVGGTDAALETADVALMTDDLQKLPWLLRHSRRTRGIIAQNIGFSLGIKAIFLGLAIPGLANLWMAIAADMGASLLVIVNGLRLLHNAMAVPRPTNRPSPDVY